MENEKISKLLEKNKYPESVFNNPNYFRDHKKRYLKILTSINFKPEMKILDIGSAPGHLSRTLKEYGCDVYNVNLTKDVNGKNIPTKILNIETEKLPYKNNMFDVILFTEILEHLLFNPVHVFYEIKRILKKGGKIILTTPNRCNILKAKDILQGKGDYDFRDEYFETPFELCKLYARHNREYIMKEIFSIFSEVNLKIVKSEYYFSTNHIGFSTPISFFIKKFRDSILIIGEKENNKNTIKHTNAQF